MSIADVHPQATSRSTRGRVPVYGFMKDGEPIELSVQSATVTLGEGSHDQAVLKVSSATLEDTDGLVDSLISFRWGATPRAETFSGYIMDVKEDKAQGGTVSLSFTMSVLGPTKAMFEGTPKFWSNKSIPSAMRDLAAKNQLGYTGHDHSYLWSALAQTRESDWATAVSFAKRIGWQIYNRYGVVMCYDPVKLFNESGIYARLVMGSTSANLETDRVLLDFQPMEESEVLTANLGRKYGYFTSNNDAADRHPARRVPGLHLRLRRGDQGPGRRQGLPRLGQRRHGPVEAVRHRTHLGGRRHLPGHVRGGGVHQQAVPQGQVRRQVVRPRHLPPDGPPAVPDDALAGPSAGHDTLCRIEEWTPPTSRSGRSPATRAGPGRPLHRPHHLDRSPLEQPPATAERHHAEAKWVSSWSERNLMSVL